MPGVDDLEDADEHDGQELRQSDAAAFRGMAARCNYLAVDRLDMQYPVTLLRRGCRNLLFDR